MTDIDTELEKYEALSDEEKEERSLEILSEEQGTADSPSEKTIEPDEPIHNDGELDGEFGRKQEIEQVPLDQLIAAEEEARQKAIMDKYEVMDVVLPSTEGFTAPPFEPGE